MSFNEELVRFTEQEIALARELDEMIEALTGLSDGDKVQESIEAGLAILGAVPGAENKKQLVLKMLVALLLDNLQEHVPFFGDDDEPV